MKKSLLVVFFSFLICLPVLAHQPYLIKGGPEVIAVKDPEVSKAYYSQLSGWPHYYEIDSPTDFKLYVNILIPAVPETTENMLVEIFKDSEQGQKLYTLDGSKFKWTAFFEPFAGDNYFKGPELTQQVTAGRYLIKVSSPDNQGKYSLAIGEKEVFTAGEIVRSLTVLPKVKAEIFNKPAVTAFFNIFGLFIWIPLVVWIVIVVFVVYLFRRYKKKKSLIQNVKK